MTSWVELAFKLAFLAVELILVTLFPSNDLIARVIVVGTSLQAYEVFSSEGALDGPFLVDTQGSVILACQLSWRFFLVETCDMAPGIGMHDHTKCRSKSSATLHFSGEALPAIMTIAPLPRPRL